VLLPVPVTALLCRGYTPSRLDTPNLPAWEHRLPQAAPLRVRFVLPPIEPGKTRLADYSQRDYLLRTDENKLLRGAEVKHQGNAGAAGRWLETACGWGRGNRALREKQDRVAGRLMSAQDEDGFIGVRSTPARWTVQDTRAQTDCLRGLLAYYTLTQRPAAIYAALSAADQLLSEHPSDPSLVFPLARLYQATSDSHYLTIARHQAQNKHSDGLGFCALYEATGRHEYLTNAQSLWAGNQALRSPALSAELLRLTGRPGYAAGSKQNAHPGLERSSRNLTPPLRVAPSLRGKG